MEFLPRTLLFYMLSHAYLFWRFHTLLGKRRAFFAALPPFLLMGLFPYVYHLLPAGATQELFGNAGTVWLPAAFFSLIVFVTADALSLLAMVFRNRFPAGALLFFSRRRHAALLALLAACLYGYGLFEAHNLRVTSLELATNKLPPGATVRIVFAADLHIGPQTGTAMLAGAVDTMLAQKPDLILIGGDVLDDAFQGTAADIRELRRLRAPLGVFAVLGNHDSFGGFQHAAETIARTGITLLSDEAVDTGPVRVIGLDDPDVTAQKRGKKKGGETAAETAGENTAALLRQKPHDRFTVLLDHRPGVGGGRAGFFDLKLSGHSHGGQIILLKSLLEDVYGTPTGFSVHGPAGESALFVTTGTGFSKLPIRLFVPPEIVVIDVRTAPPGAPPDT